MAGAVARGHQVNLEYASVRSQGLDKDHIISVQVQP